MRPQQTSLMWSNSCARPPVNGVCSGQFMPLRTFRRPVQSLMHPLGLRRSRITRLIAVMGVRAQRVVPVKLLDPADLVLPLHSEDMFIPTRATTRLPLLVGPTRRLIMRLAQSSLVMPYPGWPGRLVVALDQHHVVRVSPSQKILPLHLNFPSALLYTYIDLYKQHLYVHSDIPFTVRPENGDFFFFSSRGSYIATRIPVSYRCRCM